MDTNTEWKLIEKPKNLNVINDICSYCESDLKITMSTISLNDKECSECKARTWTQNISVPDNCDCVWKKVNTITRTCLLCHEKLKKAIETLTERIEEDKVRLKEMKNNL